MISELLGFNQRDFKHSGPLSCVGFEAPAYVDRVTAAFLVRCGTTHCPSVCYLLLSLLPRSVGGSSLTDRSVPSTRGDHTHVGMGQCWLVVLSGAPGLVTLASHRCLWTSMGPLLCLGFPVCQAGPALMSHC